MVRKYERARRSIVKQVKDATDFPPLVEETTGPLHRRPGGQPAMVHCPWHADDRTPSLAVYGDHAHCFGCGWHGDCFDRVRHRDGVDSRTGLQDGHTTEVIPQ
jgi:DNA primase